MFYVLPFLSIALAESSTGHGVEAAAPTTQVWIECQPMSNLLDIWGKLPENIQSRGVFSAISAEQFVALGGDSTGGIRAYGDENVIMAMDFAGKPDQVVELLRAMYPDNVVWTTQKGWSMELPDDRWLITLEEEQLLMHSVLSDATQVSQPQLPVDFQDINGCIAMIENGPISPVLNIPMNGGVVLPFDDQPFQIVIPSQEDLAIFEDKGASPIEVYTQERPLVVATIGLSLKDILMNPRFKSESKMTDKQIKKLQKQLRIRPGTMVGLSTFQIQNNPDVWIAMEVENRFGGLQCRWLLWRGLKKALKSENLDPLILGKDILSFNYKDNVWYVAVQKGRILLSSTRDMLDDMMTKEGDSWSNEGLKNMANTHAVAAQIEIPQMMAMMVGGVRNVNLGLKSNAEHLIFSVQPDFPGGNPLQQLITVLSGFADTSVAVTPDYQLRMMELASKEHQFFLEKGTYVTVGRSGGHPDWEWDFEASVGNSAQDLGWLSDASEVAYWVSTSPNGFVVHARFWDAATQQMIHATKNQDGFFAAEVE